MSCFSIPARLARTASDTPAFASPNVCSDFAFQEIVDRTKQPFIEEDEIEKPSPDDQNKTFRTRLVSVWLFMNTMLGIVVGRLSSAPRAYYFQAILWYVVDRM